MFKLRYNFATASPLRVREASPGSRISSSRQRPMDSRSIDLPTKKPCVMKNDSSFEFRSQDSKPELKRVFGSDSNEWTSNLSAISLIGSLRGSLVEGMSSTDQTMDDGGRSHATTTTVQNDKSNSDLSLAGLGLLSLSFDNSGAADSNSKPCDPNVLS